MTMHWRMRPNGQALRAGLAMIALAGASAAAQGNISGQGFGYSPGQLSTRSLGIGGAAAELDPLTPRNPAAVSFWGRPGLHVQYDPEIRRLTTGTDQERTVIARFPLIAAATQIGTRLVASLGISTLLDRTYTTTRIAEQVVDGETLTTTTIFESAGGINDARLALAWLVVPNLRVGIAGHVATGENRIRFTSTFDQPGYAPVAAASEVGYSGAAVSAGLSWRPFPDLALGASGRLEGPLRAKRNDTTLSTGHLPSRAGLSVAYSGITGAVLSAGADWEQWSAIDPLGSADVVARDTREIGVGAEVDGPRFRGSIVSLRAGGRWRTLPFEAAQSRVRERTVGGGVGIPLANVGGFPRATFDFAAQRAARSGPPGFRETAWTLSFGLTVRP